MTHYTRRVLDIRSKNHEKASAILFAEAYSRFLSIKILCEDGFGHSAFIVLRSLLNLFFIFHWIHAKHTESRAKRYIGWFWKIMMDMIRKDPSKYSAKHKQRIRKQYNSFKYLYRYKRKVPKTGKEYFQQAKYWYEPWTIERMAKDAGLENHYKNGYRPLSWVEHVDPTDTLLKAKTGKITFDPSFNEKILNEALIGNFSYFANICQKINKIFRVGIEKKVQELIDESKNFQRLVKL